MSFGNLWGYVTNGNLVFRGGLSLYYIIGQQNHFEERRRT